MLQNLCSNAVKFTPAHGTVAVGVRRVGDTIEIEVRDTGKGIAPEFLPHIFERFRQADASTTRVEGGLGLGLAIVQHLVQLHRGAVEAFSDGIWKGARFVVRLPLAAEEPAAPAPPLVDASRTDVRLDGLHLLLVDDEEDAREAVATALSQRGAVIHAANSVEAAMRAIAADVPDILVGDIAMPSEDGYSLIRRVRGLAPEHGGRMAAVALTAYGRLRDRAAILETGYDECLTKPIALHELAAVIGRLVQR